MLKDRGGALLRKRLRQLDQAEENNLSTTCYLLKTKRTGKVSRERNPLGGDV